MESTNIYSYSLLFLIILSVSLFIFYKHFRRKKMMIQKNNEVAAVSPKPERTIDWQDTLQEALSHNPPPISPDTVFKTHVEMDFIEEEEDQLEKPTASELKIQILAQKNKELSAELESIFFLWNSTLDETKKLKEKIRQQRELPNHLSEKILTESSDENEIYKYFNLRI